MFGGMAGLLGRRIGLDAPPGDTVFLRDDDVTADNIRHLFKSAFLKASFDDDGDILVRMDNGLNVLVIVDEQRKFLKFIAAIGFREDVDEFAKLSLLNELNTNLIFCRFGMLREGQGIAEYFLPFDEGILAFQIVEALRIFARVTLEGIRNLDKDDLVG